MPPVTGDGGFCRSRDEREGSKVEINFIPRLEIPLPPSPEAKTTGLPVESVKMNKIAISHR